MCTGNVTNNPRLTAVLFLISTLPYEAKEAEAAATEEPMAKVMLGIYMIRIAPAPHCTALHLHIICDLKP